MVVFNKSNLIKVISDRPFQDDELDEWFIKATLKRLIDQGRNIAFAYLKIGKGFKYFWRTKTDKGMGYISNEQLQKSRRNKE